MSHATWQEERERLRSSVARDERELAVAVEDLRTAARQTLAPRQAMARHVGGLMVGAFALGVWLGVRAGR